MGQLLSQPITDKATTLCESQELSYVIGSCQGWRHTMEDAHCAEEETFKVSRAIPNLSNNPNFGKEPHLMVEKQEEVVNLKIYGVFDGHGGSKTSRHLASELPRHIINEFKSSYLPHQKNNVIAILKNAFLSCDHELYRQNFNSGSTAIVAVVVNSVDLYVCNTGDSRCILGTKNNAAKNLSFDHKPNNIGELVRIQDAGGSVSMNRVNGSLALSRAFGDFNFKKKSVFVRDNQIFQTNSVSDLVEILLPSEETQVTVEPEIIYIPLDFSNDEFLVLGCDGIWDSFKNVTLVRLIREKISAGNKLDRICELIIDKILRNTDSQTGVGFDNMTVLIVALHKESTGESFLQWNDKVKRRFEEEMRLV